MMLYVGEGSEREQCPLLSSRPAFSRLPHYLQIGPFWCWFWGGCFVYVLGPCGSLQKLSCEAGFFSHWSNPTEFYRQRFWGFSSPCQNPGLHGLSQSPVVLYSYPLANVGAPIPPATTLPSQSSSCHLVAHPLHHSCLSLPLLPIWMNVSSLTLFVGLPYSLIFWKFWLFFVFKFVAVLLLVVRGGKLYLYTPPSWPEVKIEVNLKSDCRNLCGKHKVSKNLI